MVIRKKLSQLLLILSAFSRFNHFPSSHDMQLSTKEEVARQELLSARDLVELLRKDIDSQEKEQEATEQAMEDKIRSLKQRVEVTAIACR